MEVYTKILMLDERNHRVEMPQEFFGKRVKVTVVEFALSAANVKPVLPAGKITSVTEWLESFGAAPDFTEIAEFRNKVWPSKW